MGRAVSMGVISKLRRGASGGRYLILVSAVALSAGESSHILLPTRTCHLFLQGLHPDHIHLSSPLSDAGIIGRRQLPLLSVL